MLKMNERVHYKKRFMVENHQKKAGKKIKSNHDAPIVNKADLKHIINPVEMEINTKEETNLSPLLLVDKTSSVFVPNNCLKLEKDLVKMNMQSLREMVENLRYHTKILIHWSWLQLKKDLVNCLLDPQNPVYQQKKEEY